MNLTTTKKIAETRIEVVDALRGFAVIAMLLVHSVEHFIYPVYPDVENQAAWLTTLDKSNFTLTFGLFAGKAYAIFALLFGFTFHIQFSNQQKKGIGFIIYFFQVRFCKWWLSKHSHGPLEYMWKKATWIGANK